jgi:hypothetical protein
VRIRTNCSDYVIADACAVYGGSNTNDSRTDDAGINRRLPPLSTITWYVSIVDCFPRESQLAHWHTRHRRCINCGWHVLGVDTDKSDPWLRLQWSKDSLCTSMNSSSRFRTEAHSVAAHQYSPPHSIRRTS